MSKRSGQKGEKKLEDQIKPILEKLTFDVLKNKPNNIVSKLFFLSFSIATIYDRLFKGFSLHWFI